MKTVKQLEDDRKAFVAELEDLNKRRQQAQAQADALVARSKADMSGVSVNQIEKEAERQAKKQVEAIKMKRTIEELTRRIDQCNSNIADVDAAIKLATIEEAKADLWRDVDNLCDELTRLIPLIEQVGQKEQALRSAHDVRVRLPLNTATVMNDLLDCKRHATIRQRLQKDKRVELLALARELGEGELGVERRVSRMPGVDVADGKVVKVAG